MAVLDITVAYAISFLCRPIAQLQFMCVHWGIV